MNKETIYTVLLAQQRNLDGYVLHGFSYFIDRDESGRVWITEYQINKPVSVILWDKDGPELADLTEQMVKERIEEVLS